MGLLFSVPRQQGDVWQVRGALRCGLFTLTTLAFRHLLGEVL